LVPYIASKGAVVGIMRSLARALGPDGISVTGVAPGLTDTVGARPINTDARFDAVADRQALKRRLTPDDPAAAVAFLASDSAAALNRADVGHRRWARPSVAQHHRRIDRRALPPVAVASH
jgi:3-oxoacyl-[acyl-carrier protein] reductase